MAPHRDFENASQMATLGRALKASQIRPESAENTIPGLHAYGRHVGVSYASIEISGAKIESSSGIEIFQDEQHLSIRDLSILSEETEAFS